jgi:hypothetical protein
MYPDMLHMLLKLQDPPRHVCQEDTFIECLECFFYTRALTI